MSTKPDQYHTRKVKSTQEHVYSVSVLSTVIEISAQKDSWVPLVLTPIRSRTVASTHSDQPWLCLAKT